MSETNKLLRIHIKRNKVVSTIGLVHKDFAAHIKTIDDTESIINVCVKTGILGAIQVDRKVIDIKLCSERFRDFYRINRTLRKKEIIMLIWVQAR